MATDKKTRWFIDRETGWWAFGFGIGNGGFAIALGPFCFGREFV